MVNYSERVLTVRRADLGQKMFVAFRRRKVCFVSRPIEIVTFPKRNGETPKWVVDFHWKHTFRKQIMEVVEDVIDTVTTTTANPGNRPGFCVRSQKPWKSSKISHFLFFSFSCFSFFFIFHFSSFFIFLFFIFSFSFGFFLHFSSFFFFHHFFFLWIFLFSFFLNVFLLFFSFLLFFIIFSFSRFFFFHFSCRPSRRQNQKIIVEQFLS